VRRDDEAEPAGRREPDALLRRPLDGEVEGHLLRVGAEEAAQERVGGGRLEHEGQVLHAQAGAELDVRRVAGDAHPDLQLAELDAHAARRADEDEGRRAPERHRRVQGHARAGDLRRDAVGPELDHEAAMRLQATLERQRERPEVDGHR
jgi:hypothetical protein